MGKYSIESKLSMYLNKEHAVDGKQMKFNSKILNIDIEAN
jgi:hypothetical protein